MPARIRKTRQGSFVRLRSEHDRKAIDELNEVLSSPFTIGEVSEGAPFGIVGPLAAHQALALLELINQRSDRRRDAADFELQAELGRRIFPGSIDLNDSFVQERLDVLRQPVF